MIVVHQLYMRASTMDDSLKTKGDKLVLEVGVEPTCPVKGAGF